MFAVKFIDVKCSAERGNSTADRISRNQPTVLPRFNFVELHKRSAQRQQQQEINNGAEPNEGQQIEDGFFVLHSTGYNLQI